MNFRSASEILKGELKARKSVGRNLMQALAPIEENSPIAQAYMMAISLLAREADKCDKAPSVPYREAK
jgi:hypothetical protein